MTTLSIIITILGYLLLFFGWIILFSIGDYFINKGEEQKSKWSNNIGVLWLIFAIFYLIYLFITFLLTYPSILPPTLVVIFIIIISFITFRFIFPQHLSFQFRELSKYRNYSILVFLAPILTSFLLYWSKINIEVDTARVLYSSIFLAFISLLVLVTMFSIFIIERHMHHRIVNLLIQTVKGVCLVYGLTIFMSLLAMVTMPTNDVSFNYSLFTLNSSILSAIFLGTLSISINSILLTIIIFFQIVDVLKEENPPSENKSNVVFDETRLFHSECSIVNRKNDGYSELSDFLEDNSFSVSKFTIKPLNFDTLEAYDVLVIIRIDGDYSNNEIDVIERFVKEGGGLLLGSGFYDHESKNNIAKRFGVKFGPGQINQKENNFNNTTIIPEISISSEDEIFKNVTTFHLFNATYISNKGNSQILANANSTAWLQKPNEEPDMSGNFLILSKMIYGKGRVVFVSSNYQFTNEWINKLNNKQLALNIIKWLSSKEEDKQVKLEMG